MRKRDRKSLTNRQRQALSIIKGYQTLHGKAPTYSKLGEMLGVCPNSAMGHINVLIDKGYIRKLATSYEVIE